MTFTARDVAQLIDISAVQAPHGAAEIRGLVESAREHHFFAIHVLPCWVSFLKDLIAGSPDILIGSPVGFPAGAHRTEIKAAEAKLLVRDGVQEMDMMLNVGKLRSGEYRYCEEDIRAVVLAAGDVPVKVILEVHYLSRDQIKRACEACINAGAAYVKTATGWAPSGATLEVVQLITSFVGKKIKVKAAGSIRSIETLVTMYRMGVSRFGINLNSSVDIVKSVAALPGGVVDLGVVV
jgi:deoxyribose-phosphate aldolase